MPYAIVLIIVCLIIAFIIIERVKKGKNYIDNIPYIDEDPNNVEKEGYENSSYYSGPKKSSSRRRLIKGLDASYINIVKAYEYIDRDVRNKKEVISAAEWLLDNLYLIEKEYKDIKHNMPNSYYRDLPILDKGLMKGFPRIYSVALDIISKTDGRVEESSIENYIQEYQSVVVFTSGELWALPIMLRIALIQNISKIIQKMIFSQKEKNRADILADRLIDAIANKKLNSEIGKLEDEYTIFTPHFTERLLKSLRDNGVDNAEIYRWIDDKLEVQDSNSERMINIEHQKQASFQLSMKNCISGIREVEAFNWRESFEKLCCVEQVLIKDPAEIYKNMDFESRDYYRHVIEKLAKFMNITECYVAKKAIECAFEAGEQGGSDHSKHVGYYLIDDGVDLLKRKINYKSTKGSSFLNWIKGRKVALYIATIVLGTMLIMLSIILLSLHKDTNISLWRYCIAFFALLIPCSEIVVSIFNWSINKLTEPRFICKLEFLEDIPEQFSTIVVIPTLLNSEKRVHDLASDMEVCYLANQEKNLSFALLGDFKDSSLEHEENDDKIIEVALEDIENLNEKYKKNKEDADIFYFLNRFRKYNKKEKTWMGFERKRGKLMEFNELLRGEENTSYNVISGNIKDLLKVKYVITLDADTQLPRDTAKKLIGAMAHPLNRAQLDIKHKRVTRGYGVMQPRISVSTVSANKTLFSRIYSGETGIDIYSTAVSDVYQDLFGEGIFTGKGIYDIDIFNSMLKDEIPENSVLSHDLLEGCYTRTALVTDLEMIDGYPAFYNSSSMRLHRWVRGDWQLIPWILKKNTALNRLSKWKMIDNLRRSLLAPSIIILTILSFKVLPNGIDKWLSISFLSVLIPILFDVSDEVVSPIRGISLSGRIDNGKVVFEQVFLIFCFLPYQAYLMLNAVFKTIYRMVVSKRNLLQWQTAADVEILLGKDIKSFIRGMWVGSFISILILILAFLKSLSAGIFFIPYCLLWFLSPGVAYYISKPLTRANIRLSEEQIRVLRRIGRKTWAYFEDFVAPETNWLSPDNFQEDPNNGIAYRTSPTNMGMGLTSNIVAYDFGYIGIVELLDRVDIVLTNMEGLKRYKGHFYNWYDTNTKEPLKPEYVSTVDSGNLVGYIWVVSEALKEYMDNPIIRAEEINGFLDILALCDDEIVNIGGSKGFYKEIISEISEKEIDLMWWKTILLNLWSKSIETEKIKGSETLYWNSKLKHSISKYIKELQKLFPWTDIVIGRTDKIDDIVEKLKTLACKSTMKSLCFEIDYILSDLEKIFYNNSEDEEWVLQLKLLLQNGKKEISNRITQIEHLQNRLNNIVTATDFSILYDKKRQLFSIGYDLDKDTIGNSYYDLLASEARQASFVSIAKGDVEQKHWFKLGRAMSIMGKTKGLVSWSGTMFEYLMPLLIMKNYSNTLLNETYGAVVEGQKRYGKERRVPWGISESAFYNFDMNMNYQYKAFGVPGLGLKRGLVNELVISPYSSVLALQVDVLAAYNNILKLINEGAEGRYGFYESIDYTKERVPKGKKKVLVKCFMIHHQGMSLMSLDNVLRDNILQERFHRVPKVKATELLLQEKVPKRIIYDREQQYELVDINIEKQNNIVRSFNTAHTEMPETHLLSNGRYSLMVSNSGSGYSKIEDMFLYRWREDVTLDSSGMFFYIKDMGDHNYWSACYEPCKSHGEDYKVVFSLDKAAFTRRDGDITTYTEIAISNEDNAEVRRISLTNHGKETKIVEVTSYCEVTLAPLKVDIVHPAFSNLFIRTEFIEELQCVIAGRRPRTKEENTQWMMQTLAIEGEVVGNSQIETSRANFIGRGRTLSAPQVMDNDVPLKNTTGAVIDPIISLRRRLRINPGETCILAYTTATCDTREELLELARKYLEIYNVKRVFELSWTQTQVEMKYLGIKSSQANLYQLMASKIIFLNTGLKDREEYIKNIKKGQSSFWSYGISGDLPIVILLIKKESDLDYVRQLLSAHEYLSTKGLKVDLIILNNQNTSYFQSLQDNIRDIISSSHARDKQNKAGGVFSLNSSTMTSEEFDLFLAVGRLVVDSEKGLLITQVRNSSKIIKEEEELIVKNISYNWEASSIFDGDLEFFNDFGGFDRVNDEYVIRLKENKNTPAPWINVISNGEFGFHVSEGGSTYSWSKNSRENKITPWTNDYVSDTPGEVLYIRDEINGKYWTLSSNPIRDDSEYLIQHGFGYSSFSHEANGILGKLTMFVPQDDSVKIGVLKLKNLCKEDRELSVTYFAQMVMGVTPQSTAQYISTYLDKEEKYIYAKNPYNEHFGKLVTFLKIIGGEGESFTGNRKEFVGRGGGISYPLAMLRKKLSNSCGAGMDPCISENVKVNIKSYEEKDIIILFGEVEGLESIQKVINKYQQVEVVNQELNRVKKYWRDILKSIVIDTPDKSMDIIMNGWLMYQTIVCRIMARTAFYQSGGAYGFRDQLQDVLSMNYLKPEVARKQIIYSASRQFIEGDVQHWWHPVVDSGIRTRFSDDLLWLPYVTADYVKKTGDFSILKEEIGYLSEEPLKEGEDERYNVANRADVTGSLYEHCIKAIDRALKFGEHNIPLMGSGDWNDGMNTIGNKGKGESVWLGWFLYYILDEFSSICKYQKEKDRAEKYNTSRIFIKENLEKNAWDGNWYRRAYFDDGTPLGSIENDECQIDSLSQSWAVISGAAGSERAKIAMESLEQYLVKEDKGMVLLLTPPFNKSALEPGYIKGYVPGVRENGGQYTHSVTWVILALVKLGEGNKAWRIFNMINPINHTKSYFECEIYKVEPYVMAADVYAIEPHIGRGGWSWYTGASGWMYKVCLESILGLKLIDGKSFSIEPCIPTEWPGFTMSYIKDGATYNIQVSRGEKKGMKIDGKEAANNTCPFLKDGVHEVSVTI
ncbi:MAG: cyclic beta 1-2 glucan synthetase [Clostridiaceae bacterium]|nr:cyclic beta 1-2 glucan synthetase [Clostridiaceae bacterium]